LRGIQKHINKFAAQRIKPVAISVDPLDVSKNFKQRRGFTFTFLSDPNSEVISLGSPLFRVSVVA
jgi:peroxiredoxin